MKFIALLNDLPAPSLAHRPRTCIQINAVYLLSHQNPGIRVNKSSSHQFVLMERLSDGPFSIGSEGSDIFCNLERTACLVDVIAWEISLTCS